ncbi:MAG: hypothetical protein GKR87_10155 [Kiritimatiellae bacterium]|nr:hypothetical protein [Kiritimatiellia bacterium]
MRCLIAANPEKSALRRIQTELAELYIQVAEKTSDISYLDKAWDICEKVQWEYDLWFGRSIPIMAHIKKFNEVIKKGHRP